MREIAIKIAKKCDDGLTYLLNQIPDAEGDRLIAILAGLPHIEGAVMLSRASELQTLLQNYINGDDAKLVAEAIDSAAYLGFSRLLDCVRPHLRSSNPYVVGSALRYISRLHRDLAVPRAYASILAL
ncbi:MAG: hypothetical protein IH899_20885 [Planctomycetes bacterium]|nr:hypothetical protein [Planctomycetota bacterium]